MSFQSTDFAPSLPPPRGPLSAFVLDHLRRPVHPLPPSPVPADEVISGDDTQLALYLCYELHYRGLAGVDEAWEWEPSLVAFRGGLEARFVRALRRLAAPVPVRVGEIDAGLRAVVADADGPSLSVYMAERGTLSEMREFAAHRSAWQLKEADPHTWGIPRLRGRAKAAMVEIQCDEYGGGVESAMHSVLFAATMQELALDARYGAYLDLLPGVTLATVNLVSLFGLHRRWRGALIGHLATFEMTSVEPMTRYSDALARLGASPRARRFYEAHVEADAHHEIVAATDLAAGLVAAEPELARDVLFGARTLMELERGFATHVLSCWADGRTSLLGPLPGTAMEAG